MIFKQMAHEHIGIHTREVIIRIWL